MDLRWMRLCALRRWSIISESFCALSAMSGGVGADLSPYRLLDLVAEDAALEDTIYHLGRGLNSDTANIDLDRFLKVSFLLIASLLSISLTSPPPQIARPRSRSRAVPEARRHQQDPAGPRGEGAVEERYPFGGSDDGDGLS